MYSKIKEIGRGTSGKVFLAKSTTGKQLVAIKEVEISSLDIREKDLRLIRDEITNLSKLKHPNVIRYIEHFCRKSTEANSKLSVNIVMEYADGGNLHDYIKSKGHIKESELWVLLIQLSMGLSYIHGHKIVHRDIKTRNIFLCKSRPIIKIGDFGISTSLNSNRCMASTAIGTPYYLSPEICSGKSYDYKTDMWAMGCVLYEAATGFHPFDGENLRDLMAQILVGRFDETRILHLSQNLRDIICKLLSSEPEGRPSALSILDTSIVKMKAAEYQKELRAIKALETNPSISQELQSLPYSHLVARYDELRQKLSDKEALETLITYIFKGKVQVADVIQRFGHGTDINDMDLRSIVYEMSQKIVYPTTSSSDGREEDIGLMLESLNDMTQGKQRKVMIVTRVDQELFPILGTELRKAVSDFEEIEILRQFLEDALGPEALEYAYHRLSQDEKVVEEDEFQNYFRFLISTSKKHAQKVLKKRIEQTIPLNLLVQRYSQAIIELLRAENHKYQK